MYDVVKTLKVSKTSSDHYSTQLIHVEAHGINQNETKMNKKNRLRRMTVVNERIGTRSRPNAIVQ
jgi:hypothetical protein